MPLPWTVDQAVGAAVFDGAFCTGLDRQFLGGEQLFAGNFAVNDPAIHVAFLLGVGDRDGLEVVIVFEIFVGVAFPIELVDEEIEIFVVFRGHVFHEQRPRNFAAFDERLIHAEHVTAPLRLVSAKRTGRVKNARRNQPASAGFQAIGAAEVENAVVAFVPVFEAAADLGFGRAGLEAHEGVGEIVADVVVLRREIIRFRFAFQTKQRGLLGALMHVMRESGPCCRRTSNRPAIFCISSKWLSR